MVRFLTAVVLSVMVFLGPAPAKNSADDKVSVPVLVYHRFGPAVADGMTVTTSVFKAHLQWLQDYQYTVIPLRTLVDHLRGQGPPPPPKSVVICTDDGHISVYTQMLPLVRQYNIPVTLFIYPSAISNASYAMTWDQLRELKQTGLFDIQSHTYWHPNLNKEKKKLKPDAMQKLVETQFKKSKAVLEQKVGGQVDLLAWPFGIHDDYLGQEAQKAGYVAAFTIERRHAGPPEAIMALPRYLMVNADGAKRFEAIITGRAQEKGPKTY
ncbi:MAG: polysaccharide deacetylase family protein [Deltaproteobacteria bacterium]|nr:polysaccharide deacetylase family protein [Deltaproteobacteria bacterium]